MTEESKKREPPFFWGLVASGFSISGLLLLVTAVFSFLAGNWTMGTIAGLIGVVMLWGSGAYWRTYFALRGGGRREQK